MLLAVHAPDGLQDSILQPPLSRRMRGFGFVTLDEAAAATAVTELNETEFMGRSIRVNPAATERPEGRRIALQSGLPCAPVSR
jgi:RNA recognition motif-containing protein